MAKAEAAAGIDLGREFLARSRFYLNDEYRTKIRRAVEVIPANVIWQRANEGSNSVGNLLLHLAGNIGQWIVGGVGGVPNTRDRPGEFGARGGSSGNELLLQLEAVLTEADAVLTSLPAEALSERRTIQGRDVSVMEAIYTAVQHFSLHLGQIIMIAKEHSPGAVRFYEDTPDGMARPIWKVE
jgi:uncharacterized damage-inducible protein DinB